MVRASSWAVSAAACARLLLTVSAPATICGARTARRLTATTPATRPDGLATVTVRPRNARDLRTMAPQRSKRAAQHSRHRPPWVPSRYDAPTAPTRFRDAVDPLRVPRRARLDGGGAGPRREQVGGADRARRPQLPD